MLKAKRPGGADASNGKHQNVQTFKEFFVHLLNFNFTMKEVALIDEFLIRFNE